MIGAAFKNIVKLVLLGIFATFAGALPALAASNPDDDIKKMPTAPMREQVLRLAGDPTRPVTLEATLFEPPGDGPFPLMVMNHGAEGTPRTVPRYRISFSIDYALSRGFGKVCGEWSLMALCCNFTCVLSIIGIDRFVAYMAKRASKPVIPALRALWAAPGPTRTRLNTLWDKIRRQAVTSRFAVVQTA